jgi:hypothetical protein
MLQNHSNAIKQSGYKLNNFYSRHQDILPTIKA